MWREGRSTGPRKTPRPEVDLVLRGAPGTRSAEAGQRFLAYGSTEAREVAIVLRHIVNRLFRKFRKAWYAPHAGD